MNRTVDDHQGDRIPDPVLSQKRAGTENRDNRGTVLLVEDDPAVTEAITDSLREYGYAVIRATDGREALGVLRSRGQSVDILIANVDDPGWSPELFGQVRRYSPPIGMVLMSGYPESAWSSEAMPPGTPFLAKPFTLESLLTATRTAKTVFRDV